MKRPTILQIIPELDTGGAEMSAIEVAGAVASAGGRALVMSEGGRMVARLEKAGGEFVPFAAASKNPLRILWNAGAIAKFAKSEDVDLIHARSRAPAWSGFIGARRACVPFLTTYHGAYNERGPIKRAYNRVMVRGELVIAMDPSKFGAASTWAGDAETLFDDLHAIDGARLPGARRQSHREGALEAGVDVNDGLMETLEALAA